MSCKSLNSDVKQDIRYLEKFGYQSNRATGTTMVDIVDKRRQNSMSILDLWQNRNKSALLKQAKLAEAARQINRRESLRQAVSQGMLSFPNKPHIMEENLRRRTIMKRNKDYIDLRRKRQSNQLLPSNILHSASASQVKNGKVEKIDYLLHSWDSLAKENDSVKKLANKFDMYCTMALRSLSISESAGSLPSLEKLMNSMNNQSYNYQKIMSKINPSISVDINDQPQESNLRRQVQNRRASEWFSQKPPLAQSRELNRVKNELENKDPNSWPLADPLYNNYNDNRDGFSKLKAEISRLKSDIKLRKIAQSQREEEMNRIFPEEIIITEADAEERQVELNISVLKSITDSQDSIDSKNF